MEDDTRSDEPTQTLLAEAETDEWPVSDLYRVDPPDEQMAEEDREGSTVVVSSNAVEREPAPRRRLPVEPGPAVLGTILAAMLVVGLAAWLLARDGEDAAATGTPVAAAPAAPSPAGGATTPTTPASTKTQLEAVVGMQLAEARAVLERAGYRVRVARRSSSRPSGEVLVQAPQAGEAVPARALVTLTVARPAEAVVERVQTPDVVGAPVAEASRTIRRSGLRVQIELVPSDEPAGTVLSQTPAAGSEVDERSLVTLDVAAVRPAAAARVTVPDLVGATAADARRQLRELGLRARVERVVASDPAGTVLRQTPATGSEVRKGATVTLRVSTGPTTVAVPDVTGLDEESARSELVSAGFDVRVTDESTTDPTQDGIVVRQTPTGGATAAEGVVVTITVARFN